jgi:para-nitrobenzyl esterase
MRNFVVVFIVLATQSASAADSGPMVAITGGQIRGALLDMGGAVFKGIPFAQPPVEELRWREPMPVKPWSGVRDATAFGAPCVQKPNRFAPGAGEISQENCLYLNIWTPAWPPKGKRSVMVWIPGGGNTAGTASQDLYDGKSLAARGVVLVTINYRLGAFGFFSHPELSRESPHHASGNQGLLDQIAALQWVNRNIGKFGGDVGSVAIFGESAGSIDASVLMTSPLTNGLFQRVIAESGAVIGSRLAIPPTLQAAEESGSRFASKFHTPSGASLDVLRRVPSLKILENSEPPWIVIDGYVFRDSPARVFAAGREHRVSLIVGSNSREQNPLGAPPTDLRETIEQAYGPLAGRGMDLYRLSGIDPPNADALYGTAMQQWGTDTTFRCSAVAQLAWHAAAGNQAFEYEFARVPQGRELVGATHTSELAYVFGTLDTAGVGVRGDGPTAHINTADKHVSDVIQQYWTNFAKTGNPNGGQLPTWPKFDGSSRAYIQFTDAGPIAKQGLRRPFCDLFIENVRREIVH